MKTKKELGTEGENLAVEFLKQMGWSIEAQNFRFKRGELDIVALDGEVLVFVEVKYRKNNRYGFPEEFVNEHKITMLQTTATEYIRRENWQKAIRFDIVSIVGKEKPELFRDAF